MADQKGGASLPEIEESGPGTGSGHWVVIVYNNDHNSVDEVIQVLVLATKCGREEAEMETWEIHNLGRSTVHHGSQPDCETVAAVIGTIGIRVEVREE
jgi:ATP-dependent Clp protease adapter protein ClpS